MRAIEIPMSHGVAEAQVFSGGDADNPRPGVILYMDALGVRPALQERAETIAGWGYTVLLPNTFYRSGTIAEVAPDRDVSEWDGFRGFLGDKAMPRLGELGAEHMREDVPHYLRALRELPETAPTPVGAVGYCMGGRLSVLTACADAHVAVAAAFHPGGLATGEADEPIRDLRHAKAHFLFGFADNDASMDSDAIGRVEAAVRGSANSYQGAIYPGALHGFAMTDAAPHNPQATQRSLDELREALKRLG